MKLLLVRMPYRLRRWLSRQKRRLWYYLIVRKNRLDFSRTVVTCPICFREFATFIHLDQGNALCPNCGSHSRHRLLWLFLEEKISLFKESIKMLHIAPEAFFAARFQRLDNIEYIAVDKLVPGYAYPENVVGMDLQQLTFSDDIFDIVLCVHVLEHVMDDRRALDEIYRVLKKSRGLAIIMVPIGKNRKKTFEDSSILDSKGRAKVYGQWDHVRIYGDDFVERIVHAGFAVTVIDYVSGFSDDEVKKYGLITENIYLCYKPAQTVNDCNFRQ